MGQTGTQLSPATRLLVVDDDERFCRLIKGYLEPLGYVVSTANNGATGLDRALAEEFHAVILDLMLPGIDGLEVLRRLRMRSNIPVLVLTGRGEEADRIVGLEMGADDYLPKTFSTRELLARLRAVLRRAAHRDSPVEGETPEAPVTVAGLCVDAGTRVVTLDGRPLSLTRIEFDLLLSLARARGRVKSRDQLLNEVADREFDVFDRSIDVHIGSLRKKLGEDPKAPRYIETVRGVGYVLKWPESV